MQRYLANRRGARVVLILSMTGNRQLEHYYQGVINAVGEGVVMIKDEAMGDVAVSCERVIAVKSLSEPPAVQPESQNDEMEIER